MPDLRNVALTAPYFHNGGQLTLNQVVDFYNRGGDFHDQNIDNLDPDIESLGLTPDEKDALVAFLNGLTDDRVRRQQEPFDHPQLFVPNGQHGDTTAVATGANGAAIDDFLELPAVGAGGGAPLAAFLDRGVGRRSTPGTSHRDVAFLDEILRPRVPVLVALHAAARVAGPVERVDVALLLRRGRAVVAPAEEPFQHGPGLPEAPLH